MHTLELLEEFYNEEPMAIRTARIGEQIQCLSSPSDLTSSLESLSATSTFAFPTRSPPITEANISVFADMSTALSMIDISNDTASDSWSPWLGLPHSPLHLPSLSPSRPPSPAYMPRTPTPRPPLPAEALSPFPVSSPMLLRYPSLGPPPSPEIREESPDLALPIAPSPTPPDLLMPPWQLWTLQLGYPPYEVDLGEGPIILPYACFGTHLDVPWQLGKQAPDGETYARRVVSTPCHHPYLPQYPGVLDEELGIFLKDATFNFALNQSVEYTDDPGLVADVGLYRHLASEAAGWKARADQLNEFGAAYHRMQETFMGGYSTYTTELKAVEGRLVAARAISRVHVAMVHVTGLENARRL